MFIWPFFFGGICFYYNFGLEIDCRMKVKFNIRHVLPNSAVIYWVDEEKSMHPMTYNGDYVWSIRLEYFSTLRYHFLIQDKNGKTIGEDCPRLLPFDGHTDFLEIYDFWRPCSWTDVFCTAPFQLFLPKQDCHAVAFPGNEEILFSVYAPHIPRQGRLAMVDDVKDDYWNIKNAVIFNDAKKPFWECKIKQVKGKINFKFLVLDDDTKEVIAWDNQIHSLNLQHFGQHPVMVTNLPFTGLLPKWRGAGVVIPLFSLRSKNDLGIGDFGDIPMLVDWAAKTGMKVLQFLPVNDANATGTWADSYPYNIISAFAINPIYLCPEKVGTLKNNKLRTQFMCRGMHLNSLDKVDYEQSLLLKMEYAKALFQEIGKKCINSIDFKNYLKTNQSWLLPYAAHCILKQKYGTPDFSLWGEFSTYEKDKIDRFLSGHREELDFICFLQYHLWKQLKEAKAYAHEHGIILKGDIPIGVSPNGTDVWQHPDLFDRTLSVGAPPDYFSALGQVWGFPPYCWNAMKADDYRWWKSRFAYLQQFFDAYRLDHILGFFRIWAVKRGVKDGKKGIYLPHYPRLSQSAHNNLWQELGHHNLKTITEATSMLPCGEDLGSRPEFISNVLSHLNILSLDLQRMPKSGDDLGDVKDFPYLSVATTSTHDMAVLRDWWSSSPLSKRYAQLFLHAHDEIPGDPPPHVCEEIIKVNLKSRSMLAIFPLQDWLSIDSRLRHKHPAMERINDPTDAHHYWGYRMHITLEELNLATAFNLRLQQLISSTGR